MITKQQADELARASGAEMQARGMTMLTLKMSPVDAMTLLGELQLALRHPQNQDKLADRTREIAHEIENYLAYFGPATAEIARRGWDTDDQIDDDES